MKSNEAHERLKRDTQHVSFTREGAVVVYHESLKRELKTKPINESRCDERLKTRV